MARSMGNDPTSFLLDKQTPILQAPSALLAYSVSRLLAYSVSRLLACRASFSIRLILSISFGVQHGCMPILLGLHMGQLLRLDL